MKRNIVQSILLNPNMLLYFISILLLLKFIYILLYIMFVFIRNKSPNIHLPIFQPLILTTLSSNV